MAFKSLLVFTCNLISATRSSRLSVSSKSLLPIGIFALLIVTIGAIATTACVKSTPDARWMRGSATFTRALHQARTLVDELILIEHRYLLSGEDHYLAQSEMLRKQLNLSLQKLEDLAFDHSRPKRPFPRVSERLSGYSPAQSTGSIEQIAVSTAQNNGTLTFAVATQGDTHTIESIERQLETLHQSEYIALEENVIKQLERHQIWTAIAVTLSMTAAILIFVMLFLVRLTHKNASMATSTLASLFDNTPAAQTSRRPSHATNWDTRDPITLARAEERANIARDIHDELGALLMAIKIDMKFSSRVPEKPRRSVDSQWPVMLERVNAAMRVVTNIAEKLRPSIIEQVGLLPAVQSHFQKFEQFTKMQCNLHTEIDQTPPNGPVAADVFRIFQEALTNIARHADASSVNVSLRIKNDLLRLEILDDGKGIGADQILSTHSIGIAGMSERAQRVGGSLQIEGEPGRGTSVTFQMPLTLRA